MSFVLGRPTKIARITRQSSFIKTSEREVRGSAWGPKLPPFVPCRGPRGPKLFPSKPNNPHHTLVLRVSLKYSVVLVGVLLGHYIAVWCACILSTRMNECPFFRHCPNSHWTPLHLRSCSLAGIFSNLILLSLL